MKGTLAEPAGGSERGSGCQSARPYGSVDSRLPSALYEFPNGYRRRFGAERLRLAEILFNPRAFAAAPPESAESLDKLVGIHQMAIASISSCDPDIRPGLFSSIIVTGGNTLTTGFMDRLQNEMQRVAPAVRACCDRRSRGPCA